ncbi:hypothetical protein M436DRAFT_82333 [Aureobasidium namibiae CBS 147.97]|uniref:Uncharacterized protein n=1 Tax=Aureobasidium namibiae CBS 147.97 TaxID=1043004 RepID=A0A074WJ50_9PEZI
MTSLPDIEGSASTALVNGGSSSIGRAISIPKRIIFAKASPVFFRSKRFPLVLQLQPHTEITVLAFDLKTREWFSLIGNERINAFRHVVFQFAPIEQAIFAAGGYSIDLSCGDASNWEYHVKIDDKSDLCLLAAEFREEHIRMCKAAIELARDALDNFTNTYVLGKHIQTTADALGELGGALVAVEKARFQHTSP